MIFLCCLLGRIAMGLSLVAAALRRTLMAYGLCLTCRLWRKPRLTARTVSPAGNFLFCLAGNHGAQAACQNSVDLPMKRGRPPSQRLWATWALMRQ
ncbi:hypothetical protein KCP75_19510 [Salmonella enterica subsp. enterica]|nr:hypothetical protein KCP75_19510 [Salmonella enterica subsp. enterica]